MKISDLIPSCHTEVITLRPSLQMPHGYPWGASGAGVQKSDAGVGIGTLIGDRDYFAQK